MAVAKPKVKVTKKGDVTFAQLTAQIKKARGSYVTIGILEPERRYPPQVSPPKKGGKKVAKKGAKAAPGPTLGQVAAWMEFGTHSKKGVEIVPARSFLRSPIDRGMAGIERTKVRALTALVNGTITLQQALGMLGAECQRRMQNAIIKAEHGIPLDPKTIERKRELGQPDIPLIATGLLKSAISFAVTVVGKGTKAGKTK